MTDTMKAADSVENEVNDILQKKDFGAPLKRAREEAGMSLGNVAENLLISVDTIKALESSQVDALPALTFTLGYIRSYARLLGISAEEIIDDYVHMAPDSKPVLTSQNVLPIQKCSNDNVVKFISFSFVVVAIIVLVFWLVNTDFALKTDVVADAPNEIASSELAEFDSQKPGEPQFKGSSGDPASQQSTLSIEPTVDTEKKLVPEEVQKPDFIPDLNPDSRESTHTNEVSVAQTSSDNENQKSSAVDKLFLSALGDSWCEIQDSAGKRLYYQLLNTGDEIELTGTAPFTVFLGNAPKIRVEINSKIVDFENLINKNSNIATLEISKDATVVPLSSH